MSGDPVAAVRVYYGDAQRGFSSIEMERFDGDAYRAVVPLAGSGAGLSYFIEASDSRGRLSTWPQDGRANPVAVLLTGDEQPLGPWSTSRLPAPKLSSRCTLP